MDNFKEFFKEKLIDRATNIDNDTATTNQKCKELSEKIRQLEDEMIKLLPDHFKLFDDYRDAVLQREALVIQLVYLNGFQDGSELKQMFIR